MSKILVIDDEELVRMLIQQILEDAGHVVFGACDGLQGIRVCKEQQPDLVITDMLMPNKEGLETIIELKRDFPELKIIAMSGGGRTNNRGFLDLASKLGAIAIIKKPFDNDKMLNLVQGALAQ